VEYGHGNMLEFDGGDLRFDQALSQTRMAVCITNPRLADNPIVFANDAFLELTGYRLRDVLGRNCRLLQGPKTNRAEVAKLGEAVRAEKSVVVELLNYRKDGTPFWNALHIGPIFGDSGELLYYFGSQWDITEVHEARDGERMLGRDLSKRFKSVFSVLGQTMNFATRSTGEADMPETVGERLSAMGRAYDVSFQRRGGAPLSDIVDTVMGAYARTGAYAGMGGGAYVASGPVVSVPEELLSTLALCLHELAMESATSGAWMRGGRVRISWEETGSGVEILWQGDEGAAPEAPQSAVLDELLASFKGQVHHEGDRIRIVLPMQTERTLQD